MSERDVMAALAAANPVRVGDVPELEFPRSALARPPRTRKLLLAAAFVALAGVLVAVFGFAGSGSGRQHRGAGTDRQARHVFPRLQNPRSGLGVGSPPTVDHPLSPGAQAVSLGDAQAALGAPIILPDTSPIGSPAMGSVWLSRSGTETVVAVTYPAAGTWAEYQVGANRYYDDVLLLYQAIAKEEPAGSRVVDVNGVPALGEEGTEGNTASIMFDAGGARVTIIGHQRLAKLEVLAQSIVGGSTSQPPGQLGNVAGVQLFPTLADTRQIALAVAPATLGAPVVIPDTSTANLSRVGQVWAEGRCPASGATAWDSSDGRACWIWISFPAAGLSVGYLRPPMYAGTRREWEGQARRYGKNASVVDLHGVPALAITSAGPFPGSVEFDLAGSRIVVAGDHDTATLQSVARSIVDRSRFG